MQLNRRALLGTSFAYFLASCANAPPAAAPAAPAPPATPPKIGAWGVDLSARDLSVKPGDDFFRYVNGGWINATEIPADRTSWGSFQVLDDEADRAVKTIVEEVAHSGGAPGTNAQKIADYYNAYLDQAAIDAKGLQPAQADLAAIAALGNHTEIARLIARPDMPVASPIGFYIDTDARNPDRYIVYITHGGLGLGERQFYLRTEDQFVQIRAQYEAHIARVLTLGGMTNTAAKARQVFAFETQIAQLHWPIADRRQRDRVYNLKTRAELDALDARFPWTAFLEGAELADQQEFVVRELSAIGPIAALCRRTPLSTWKAYLTFHYLHAKADVLPSNVDAANFDFFGKTLNGQPQQRERWRRGVDAVNDALGEAIGQIYVARHFPPEAKQQALALVENMRSAYAARIQALDWMSAETKTAALEKLRLFRPKIGYPDRWRDYSGFDVQAGDAFGNSIRAAVFEWRRERARLGHPTDRDEWLILPQTVNAYYESKFNEICFPAAILQAPFFDPNADLAVNYGGIGAVIGHEMGHGFDDQGAKSDGHGVLRDWWNAQDVERFGVLVHKLAAQYDSYEALPGIHVNGSLTSGENIGDNGGLQVALHAYGLATNGQTPPDIDGITAAQRFFLGFGQIWRAKYRDERLRNLTLTDPHSPSIFRVNGVVRNMEAWYAAFGVQPGDALYLAPADRVLIW